VSFVKYKTKLYSAVELVQILYVYSGNFAQIRMSFGLYVMDLSAQVRQASYSFPKLSEVEMRKNGSRGNDFFPAAFTGR
jgi:hypothetical protein